MKVSCRNLKRSFRLRVSAILMKFFPNPFTSRFNNIFILKIIIRKEKIWILAEKRGRVLIKTIKFKKGMIGLDFNLSIFKKKTRTRSNYQNTDIEIEKLYKILSKINYF